MTNYIYAFVDDVAGYAINTQITQVEPDKAEIIFPRQMMMQPSLVMRDCRVMLVGSFDDDSLVVTPCNPKKVCDFKEVFEKLDNLAERKKIIEDAKREAEAIKAKAQEGAVHGEN